ncbi:MAG: hypothetical protein EOO73_05285 [Myxococcales bacterium]|nr:MAG: hypothetical protein EOO73_05285 [Myxococcales bacterium]
MFPRVMRTKAAKEKEIPEDKIFLAVSVNLKRKDRQPFELLADELLPRFKNAGLELVVGSWREEGDVLRLFNLWGMKDPRALITSELKLVDDPDYLRIDQLLFGEIKNVVFRVSDDSLKPVDPADTTAYCYVRVINEIDTSKLAEFRARHDARVQEFRDATGWGMGDAFLGVTGADTIMQIWQVPVDERANISDYLVRTPWDDLLDRPPTFEIFHPTPFDSLMPRFLSAAKRRHRWDIKRAV